MRRRRYGKGEAECNGPFAGPIADQFLRGVPVPHAQRLLHPLSVQRTLNPYGALAALPFAGVGLPGVGARPQVAAPEIQHDYLRTNLENSITRGTQLERGFLLIDKSCVFSILHGGGGGSRTPVRRAERSGDYMLVSFAYRIRQRP